MTVFQYARPAVCVAALLSGTAALADVTAQQVWGDLRTNLDMYGEGGITIGSETMAGNALTVAGIAVNSETPDGNVTGMLDQLVFTENGDGTVTITMSEDFRMTFNSDPAYGPATSATVVMRNSGMNLTVSGTPEQMTYDLTADRYAISVDEITEDGEPVDAEVMVSLNNISGSYTSATGETLRDLSYDMAAASLDMLVDVTDDETIVNFSGQIADLATRASITLPAVIDPDAPESVFKDGLAIEGGYSFGALSYLFDVTEYGDQLTGTATAAGGSFDFGMGMDGMSYASAARDIAVSLTTVELPFPVTVSLAEIGMNLQVPLARTDAPTDYSAGINITNLAVNDEIWSMFDPTGVLPRDPATAIINLSGTARMLFDALDPEQAMQMAMAEAPFEPHTLSLDQLNVSVAGANLTGTGAFTFDNTDLATFGGLPRPEGTATFQIAGVNGLIDKLVQMGLIPEEEAMMPRMMLGMFATATGDDQMESKVEVNAQGHLLVNGQRLQ